VDLLPIPLGATSFSRDQRKRVHFRLKVLCELTLVRTSPGKQHKMVVSILLLDSLEIVVIYLFFRVPSFCLAVSCSSWENKGHSFVIRFRYGRLYINSQNTKLFLDALALS
jgi:hypothetical protein